MGDAIISAALGQLKSTVFEEAKERVKLVICVDNEVDSLRKNFEAIGAVMVDADRRQWKEERVRLWLEELKQASYDMEDVLDEWNTARLELKSEGDADENALMKKVCSFFLAAASCFGLEQVCSFFRADSCFGVTQICLHHDIARKIKKINKNLDDIAKRKDSFNFNVNATVEESKLVKSERVQTTAFMSKVCGREKEKDALKKLCESSAEQNGVQIISLVGMGGIGKTTLAQYAYNQQGEVDSLCKRMWVCVSDPFDQLSVARAILEALERSAPNLNELNSLLERINESIAGKRFFLVLDDVWIDNDRKWEPFRNCLMKGLRGTILVTTRKEDTAKIMGSTTDNIIPITGLAKHECWSLFERFAFFDRSPSEIEQLQEIGRNIVKKCKGLPLAVKTIGSLLRSKKTREGWQIISDSELWQAEVFEESIGGPLLLSYYDLPSKIKRCFSYCAVFPKDYYIQKDELIQLWMAQGYIEPGNNEDLETMGETYFNCLATRSFFQEFRYNHDGTTRDCKMHDIVHDFAQFLVKDEFSFMQIDGSQELSCKTFDPEKLRHSMLVVGKDAPVPDSKFKGKKLRSLLINFTGFKIDSFGVVQNLFNEQTCLRALKVARRDRWADYRRADSDSQMTVNELMKEIGKLIHLRYLSIDIIKELPEIWCKLCNLQTLEFNEVYLRRLPRGIGKLVNLRHLILNTTCLDYMPKGVERLTSLRTLRGFVVVRSDGKYGREACKLDGLKELNHLRGSLSIRGLGNVTDFDEAKNAHLEKKKNLVSLTLRFDEELIERDEEAIAGMDHEEIIEALRPPPNLEFLKLNVYYGKTLFSSWITSLNKLKSLQLEVFSYLEIMPPLGKLPSLEELKLMLMERIKRVGDEFLGIESSNHADGTSSSITAFPKLKTLLLAQLNEWEEWDFGNEDITVMPQLSYLWIGGCNKLKSIPNQLLRSTTMEKLEILHCDILTELFKETGENWSKISHIPTIKIYESFPDA